MGVTSTAIAGSTNQSVSFRAFPELRPATPQPDRRKNCRARLDRAGGARPRLPPRRERLGLGLRAEGRTCRPADAAFLFVRHRAWEVRRGLRRAGRAREPARPAL